MRRIITISVSREEQETIAKRASHHESVSEYVRSLVRRDTRKRLPLPRSANDRRIPRPPTCLVTSNFAPARQLNVSLADQEHDVWDAKFI